MVFGKFVTEEKDRQEVLRIRDAVYAENPVLRNADEMQDAFCIYALVYAGEEPAGMGSMYFDGENFGIREIAVLSEFRGQQYGDFLVRLLIDKAVMSNAQEIHLDALHGTEAFFAKVGFAKEGSLFEKSSTMWQPMLLHTDQIHKCCGCGKQTT